MTFKIGDVVKRSQWGRDTGYESACDGCKIVMISPMSSPQPVYGEVIKIQNESGWYRYVYELALELVVKQPRKPTGFGLFLREHNL